VKILSILIMQFTHLKALLSMDYSKSPSKVEEDRIFWPKYGLFIEIGSGDN